MKFTTISNWTHGAKWPFTVAVLVALLLANIWFIHLTESSPSSPAPHRRPPPPDKTEEYNNNLQHAEKNALMFKEAIAQIKDENYDKILKKLEKDIKSNNEQKIIKQLKNQISGELTKQAYKEAQLSPKLVSSFKASYFELHEDELKLSISKDIIAGLEKEPKFEEFVKNNEQGKEIKDFIFKQLDNVKEAPSRGEFLSKVLTLIIFPNDPKVQFEKKQKRNSAPSIYFNDINKENRLSYQKLTYKKLEPTKSQLESLQQAHDKVVLLLRLLDVPSESVYSGRGIVINTVRDAIGGVMVIIAQIRDLGTTLPIEVVMNSEKEADSVFCDKILPQYDAKCIFIQKMLPESEVVSKLTKLQAKIAGILISSFEEAIILDSGNLPIKGMDALLYNPEYLTTGFLIWPDLWAKTTSPYFYDIARFDKGEVIRREGLKNDEDFVEYTKEERSEIALHDFEGLPSGRTAETGQLVINKQKHIKSLLLSLYYNVYGPDCYYYLLSQGAGEGNMETFVPALHVMEEPYHMINKDPIHLGYRSGPNTENKFVETALVQFELASAKSYLKEWKKWLSFRKHDTRLWPFQKNSFTESLVNSFEDYLKEDLKKKKIYLEGELLHEPIFLHTIFPKINPVSNFKRAKVFEQRNFGIMKDYEKFLGSEIDYELKFHSISMWVACDALKDSTIFEHSGVEQKLVCESVTKYVQYLQKTSSAPQSIYPAAASLLPPIQ